MKGSGVNWKQSIFTRLNFAFLLIILPIFVLGIGIFKWSRTQMSEKISSSINSQISYHLLSFDNDIKRIKKLQSDLTQDEDLYKISSKFKILNKYEETRAILRISQRITAIKNSSPYIDYVTVIIPSMEWAIYDSEYSKGIFRGIPKKEVDEIKKLQTSSDLEILYLNDQIFLCSTFPNYYDNKIEPMFIIQVFLSKKAIKEELILNNYKNGMFILDRPSQNFIIDHVSDNKLQQPMHEIIDQYSKGKKRDVVSTRVNGKKYLMIYVTSKFTNITLSVFLLESDVLNTLRTLELWYWSFFLLIILIIAIFSFYSNRLIKKPLGRLIKSFAQVENGDFEIDMNYTRNDEVGYLYKHFIKMVENLKILIDQAYKQKILAQRAELKQLQSQINPHFLYNSFFVLHRRIKGGDYENAIEFSQQLGKYFRFITRNDADEVTLAKEVEHARIYAEIQEMRFSNRIRLDFGDLPQEIECVMVPRLILQPIIENSFAYGLENKKQDGILKISFEHHADKISIKIEDNGDGLKDEMLMKLGDKLMSEDPMLEVTGIVNIHRRIWLKFGKESGLTISRSKLGGMKVKINIFVN